MSRNRNTLGQEKIGVSAAADKNLQPGKYVLLVSVTDGLISQGAYIDLEVAK